MKRTIAVLTMIGALAAAAGATERETTGDLTILPSRVETYTEYRVNTGRKAVLADGTYNDVYRMKTPAKGHVFLDVSLDLAYDGEMSLGPEDVRLVDATQKDMATIVPFDRFLDQGLTQDRGETLMFTDKTTLEAIFEVPAGRMNDLVLFIGDHRVGTVREIRDRAPDLL